MKASKLKRQRFYPNVILQRCYIDVRFPQKAQHNNKKSKKNIFVVTKRQEGDYIPRTNIKCQLSQKQMNK